MVKRRYIATDMWQSRWFVELSNGAKYLYMYLITSPRTNLCGIYEIMDNQIEFETKVDNLIDSFRELEQRGEVIRSDDWCVITRFPAFQKWRNSKSIAIGIVKQLVDIPFDILEIARNSDYAKHYPPILEREFIDEYGRIDSMSGKKANQPHSPSIPKQQESDAIDYSVDNDEEDLMNIPF